VFSFCLNDSLLILIVICEQGRIKSCSLIELKYAKSRVFLLWPVSVFWDYFYKKHPISLYELPRIKADWQFLYQAVFCTRFLALYKESIGYRLNRLPKNMFL